MTPEKIGKYKVIDLLGRGGMGEVYLGEDPYIGRRVAIKIIQGADPEARERFLHEARVIGGLAHPSIVSLLDFDFLGDEPFLVMEYLKGQGLDRWLKEPHALTEQMVVLEDVCEALSYAHRNGVLHRDVKPSNVQILPDGRAKLMDFGIARGAGGKLTATGAVMGTPEYMAPEILNDAAYSVRSDLYACAVLLYEMFTGSNPFAARTVAATLTNVLTLNPPDVLSIRPELPRPLAATLMACLRKNPEERPEGMGALIAAARPAGEGAAPFGLPETREIPMAADEPAGSGASAVLPVEASEARKARAGFWWGGAAVVLALGLLSLLTRDSAPPAPREASAPAPTAVPSPPGDDLRPRVEATASASPVAMAAAQPPLRALRRAPAEATPVPLPPATPRAEEAPPKQALPSSTPPPSVDPAPDPAPPSLVEPSPRPTATAPLPASPSPQSVPSPVLATVSPRTVRRGSSVVLDVEGSGLRRDLVASVLQGRRPAAGIRVVRQEFVNSTHVRVTILIEPEVPLLAYTVVFRDPSGVPTQGLQIEVVL